MHIGLIGGIGPAATVFYYRRLVAASQAAGRPFAMTITQADNRTLVANFHADDRAAQARIFARHVGALAGAGARVAAVTALAGHFCIAETAAAAPLPMVDALAEVRAAVDRAGHRRLGLLGAGRVMETGLFGALEGLDLVRPGDVDASGRRYLAMAQRGACLPEDREAFFAEGARMMDAGAEAVLLAGTDLFLAFEDRDPGYPVIDGGEVHIAALAALAAEGPA